MATDYKALGKRISNARKQAGITQEALGEQLNMTRKHISVIESAIKRPSLDIGNNLNQIAAFFNSGGIQSRAMLEEINRCMTDLRAMRKEIAGLAGDYRGNLKTRRG